MQIQGHQGQALLLLIQSTLSGQWSTLLYSSASYFLHGREYCLNCESVLSSKITFVGFLRQFKCPMPSSEHLPTESLQVMQPEDPGGDQVCSNGAAWVRQPANSIIELSVFLKGCGLSSTSCPGKWVKPGRSMSLKISSSFQ